MDFSAPEPTYQIFTSRTRKKTVRFLVTPAVMEQIPYLEEILMRAATGGGKSADIYWPESVVLCGEGEELRKPHESFVMVLPNWLFENVEFELKRGIPLAQRLVGDVASRRSYRDIAYVLAHYLIPLQKDEYCRKHCYILLDVSLFFPIEYRPIRTTLSGLLILPILAALFLAIYGGAAIFRNNTKLLYKKAKLQWDLGHAQGLSRTRQRLRELGEPEEKLKALVTRPCLTVVKQEQTD